MAITIQCPFCGTPAEIEEALLGKKLRCANSSCRKAFRITPSGEALPVVERDRSSRGSADWASAPPPVRGGDGEADWMAAPPPVAGSRRAAPTVPDEGEEFQQAYAQPYAEGEYADEGEATYDTGQPYGGADYYGTYPTRSKKGKFIGIGIVLLIALGIIGGAVFYFSQAQKNRASIEQEAEALLNRGDAGRAKDAFQKLSTEFPNEAEKYKFFLSWIDVQQNVAPGPADKLKAAEASLLNFFETYKGSEAFREKNYRSKVWTAAVQLADLAATEADRSADPSMVAVAEKMIDLAKNTISSEKDQAEAEKKQSAAEEKLAQAKEAIATSNAAAQVDNEIAKVQRSRQPAGIERVQELYARNLRDHPRLAQDSELTGKLEALKAAEAGWVLFKAVNEEAEKPADEKEATSLLVTPPIKSAPANAAAEGVVLALARGTVYGLSAKDGKPRWAMRVGIDVQGLPARLPTRRGQKDLALILSQSQDNKTILNAIDVNTGKREWFRTLPAACPAGPVLVGFRAYVPTLDGKLSVVNIADGKLVGTYDTGARLTVPIGVDRQNNLLFVPADAKRIFVIDAAKNKCAGVIYTNHAAGSLRGAPVVAGTSRLTPAGGSDDGAAQGTFVLAEGTGMGGMKVRVFPTQAQAKEAKPLAEYALQGQSWFTPYHDGDQLGLVTDKGILAIYGVNRDTGDTAPLLPLVDQLIPGVVPPGTDSTNVQPKARAQVAFVGLGTWWVLVDNRLLHLRVDPFRKAIVPVPALTMDLGSPLHESTLSPDGRLVVVVSQSPDRRILASALDRVTGALVWQNQLGLVPTQDSVSLGNEVLTIDKSGALFLVDARQVPSQLEVPWLSIGDWPAGNVKGMTYARLLRTPNGKAAIALTYNSLTGQILLRRFEPGKGITAERAYSLSSPPHGTATCSDEGTVVIPCRDGNLREFNINSLAAAAVVGTWRDPTAASTTPGHALLLSNNELLATDGQRKLLRWERSDGKAWSQIQAAALSLPGRVVTPIASIVDGSNQPNAVVGDDTGKVYLLGVGNLPSQREWEAKGTITRGPFRIGPSSIGCVVDQKRLVWFDVNGADGQVLEFDAASGGDVEAGIVGQPQAIGDLLLIPELSGRFTWLNLKTGEPVGQPMQLVGSLVPASGAVPLGAGLSFAPLSDGTVMLVPLPRKE